MLVAFIYEKMEFGSFCSENHSRLHKKLFKRTAFEKFRVWLTLVWIHHKNTPWPSPFQPTTKKIFWLSLHLPRNQVTSFTESQSHHIMSMNNDVIGLIDQHQHKLKVISNAQFVNLGSSFTFSGIPIWWLRPKLLQARATIEPLFSRHRVIIIFSKYWFLVLCLQIQKPCKRRANPLLVVNLNNCSEAWL